MFLSPSGSSPSARWLRGLGLVAAAWSATSAAQADDHVLRGLARALAAGEVLSLAARADEQRGGAAKADGLREALAEMERRDTARRREFSSAAARRLPPRAAERLARTREAYEAGQGRLVTLLRILAARRDGAARAEATESVVLREAAEIAERLLAASRAEPLSAGELKVRPPSLAALPRAAATSTDAPKAAQEEEAPLTPVPQVLRDAAATLTGPVEAYEWVRNNIRTEFYHGAMKGPVETYYEGSGNDADTASVLVEMLRAKGIPARYVRGHAVLSAPTLKSITGTATAEQAVRVLDRAGIPHDPPVLGAGGITSVRTERVWVEAYVPYANYRGSPLDAQGKLWIPLDPAFKRLESPHGIDAVRELGFDARAALDDFLAVSTSQTPLEFARGRVGTLIAAQRPDLNYADVLNRREPLAESLGILPATLPYAAAATEVGYDLPDSLRHSVRFTADAAGRTVLDATLPVADLLGRRVTLSYVPASEEDAEVARAFGGVLSTPPYLIEVRPVLKVGGVSVAAGSGALGMGVRYTLRVELRTPGGRETLVNRVLAGNLTSFGLGGRSLPQSEEIGGVAAQMLSGIASTYLDRWNRSDDELARLLHVVPVRPTVSECMVMSDFEVEYAGGDPDYPLKLDWKGIAIDADLRASAPVGVADTGSERPFLLLSGLEGSVLEHRAFEDALQIESVSTANALQLAAEQGTAVLDITGENVDSVLPGLALEPTVSEEIREAAGRGLHVRVPSAPVTRRAWTGVGYLLLDEETGAAAYQLQGGHSGGVTAAAVVDIPRTVVDALAEQGEDLPPAPEDAEVAQVQKFVSTDLQEATVGTVLTKPLKVRVTDASGQVVRGANVVFTVIGGEGGLRDPADLTFKSEIVVRSDDRGEAVAALRLGTNTGLIPRFTCLTERWDCTLPGRYLTQVGLNLVTARAGRATLAEPFTGVGFPDDKFDGERMQALLDVSSTAGPATWYNLTVADRLMVAARDPFRNPISNFPVRFAFRPPPIPDTPPPGTSRLGGTTDTPGRLLSPRDYEECSRLTPSPAWGQCPGEASDLLQRTSSIGAFGYMVIGDSAYSSYIFDVGSDVEPSLFAATYHTSGFICQSPNPADCGTKPSPPVVLHGARARHLNRLGNMVEAYPLGGDASVQLYAYALSEVERIEKVVDDGGAVHYRAVRTSSWRREPLTNSEFRLAPQTPGTTVSPPVAPHTGGGIYGATMAMGPDPQLNAIGYSGTHRPLVIPYRQDRPDDVDPTYVTDNGIDPPTVTRVPGLAQQAAGDFGLWGVKVSVKAVAPFPLILDAGGAVVRPAEVRQEIAPESYRSLLDPLDVLFEVDHDGQAVMAATGLGTFAIPRGLAFPPGLHTASVKVLRASADERVIAAVPFPLDACPLVTLARDKVFLNLTRDLVNEGTLCGSEGRIEVRLCRPALVTLTVGGASVVQNLPMEAGPGSILLPPALLGLDPNAVAPFEVKVVDRDDPTLQAVAVGTVESSIINRAVLPVGHTFVKGVDLFDGHLVQQATDFKVPGRHLGIEMTRTYSSAGRSPAGVLGAGWSWSYSAALYIADCGVIVTTADGSSQAFSSTDGGHTFRPQKGYHTRLVQNSDGSYDFFDKSHTRHHFKAPVDPTAPAPERERRLEYVEEPHGDRLRFTYDGLSRLTRVAEWHPEAGDVRVLELTYDRKQGFDRIVSAAIPSLNLQVSYAYDVEGNLISSTRSGRNVDGPDAPDRVETYRYSVADPRDRHQMLEHVDANGNRVAYEYYLKTDVFPGEVGAGGLPPGVVKEEHVKFVREFPDGPTTTRSLETRFTYDFSEILLLRPKAAVKDARGNETRYVLNADGSPLRVEEPFEEGTRTRVMEWSATDIVKTKETDPLGRVTEYGYDSNGNLTSERIATADLGPIETVYAYDPKFNKLTLKKDAEGRETRYEIDASSGDLLQMTDAVGNLTRYEYDADHGLLLRRVDPRGHTTRHEDHDTFGNARLITDPVGNTTTPDYDARGRLKEQSDTLGHHVVTAWDGLDRAVEETRFVAVSGDAVESSDDAMTRTEYYAGGQPRLVTGPNGAVTRYQLDGLNRVVLTETMVEGGPYLTRVAYDGNGNKVQETDRRGVTRTFTYDKLNRLREVSIAEESAAGGPFGRVAAYTYDLVGNKTSESDVGGNRTGFVYDGLYRVKTRVLAESNTAGQPYEEKYAYDRVGNRISLIDANGHETRFEYDGVNRLLETTNALSQVVRTEYDDPEGSHVNRSFERDDTRGLTRRYAYDAMNREVERRVQFVDALSGEPVDYLTATAYDDAGHSLTVTDPRGIATRTRLDGMDRVIETVVDVGGLDLSTQASYDGLGNRKAQRDPNRNPASRWVHDGLGRQVRMVDALGHASTATYDGEGLKLSETDRRGISRLLSYDSLGRPRLTRVPATLPGSQPWSHEVRYFDLAHRREEYDARGTRTLFDLDRLGRVVRETDIFDHAAETTYDGVGNKLTEKDRRGFITASEYDPLNRVTRVRDPLGQVAETTYDDGQNRRIDEDKRGIVRLTQMDALGRERRVVRPFDAVTGEGTPLETHSYDGDNNRLSTTDAEGKVTGFEYDRANRLRRRIDGQGSPAEAATVFAYDDNGNKTEEIDARSTPEQPSMRFRYDALNRVARVVDGEGDETAYAYDHEGNRTLVREPEGQETEFAYDELGKLLLVTQPPPLAGEPRPVTAHAYDESRNRVKQTDANGHVVSMSYDRLDRLTRMVQDPEGLELVTRHEYDENGNETGLTDAKGQVVTSTFDSLDRLKTKAYAFAPGDSVRPWRHTTGITYAYDANGNLARVDEAVASGTDPPATLTTLRGYDELDRLTSETSPLPDGGTRTVSYTYYRNGTRETVTDPGGLVTRYTYDGQNRLETAAVPSPSAGGVPSPPVGGEGQGEGGLVTYTYYPDDLLHTVTYPNGVVATHVYDKADRLLSLANAQRAATLSSYAYAYDRNGNRLRQTETNGPVETTTYTYDGLDRLKTVTYPTDARFPNGRVVTYAHDAVGNRLRETEKDSLGAVLADKQGVFDNINRLTALDDVVSPALSTHFTWDANGNQIAKTVGLGPSASITSYSYDVRDKLVEAVHGASILGRFQYDFGGRRIKKIGAEGVRQYVYDQASVLLEYDDAGQPVAKYDYGSDRLISLVRRDEPRRFYSLDGLRSVVGLTDDGGSTVAAYHLDAWGNFRFPEELTASRNRFAFTGYEWDAETGFFNAKARYFDPGLGRFLSQDSFLGQVDEPPSLHRYFYANANPTTFVDPTGHYSMRELGQDVKWGADLYTSFQKEFSVGVAETGANIFTLGGYGGIKQGFEEGRITGTDFGSAGRAYAEGVFSTITLGGGNRAVGAYAEGNGAGGIAIEAVKGAGETVLPINEFKALADPTKSGWKKAEAIASATTKIASLAAGGLAAKNALAQRAGTRAAVATESAAGAEATLTPTEGTLPPVRPLPRVAGGSQAADVAQTAEQATVRQRVLANIEESRAARNASRFGEYERFDRLFQQAGAVDVSTARNQAVFYSGRGGLNRAAAEAFAAKTGKLTLERTPGGSLFDKMRLLDPGSPLPPRQALAIWKWLSERYASGASGTVNIFARESSVRSLFNMVELPAMRETGLVYKYVYREY